MRKEVKCNICNKIGAKEYALIKPDGAHYTICLCEACKEYYEKIGYFVKLYEYNEE